MNKKLVDFNGRKYDRHVLYARYMGESNEQCYMRSQAIINGARDIMGVGYIGSAWNMGFLDLYDLATEKQSLKNGKSVYTYHMSKTIYLGTNQFLWKNGKRWRIIIETMLVLQCAYVRT